MMNGRHSRRRSSLLTRDERTSVGSAGSNPSILSRISWLKPQYPQLDQLARTPVSSVGSAGTRLQHNGNTSRMASDSKSLEAESEYRDAAESPECSQTSEATLTVIRAYAAAGNLEQGNISEFSESENSCTTHPKANGSPPMRSCFLSASYGTRRRIRASQKIGVANITFSR